jgi:hypothetical protein
MRERWGGFNSLLWRGEREGGDRSERDEGSSNREERASDSHIVSIVGMDIVTFAILQLEIEPPKRGGRVSFEPRNIGALGERILPLLPVDAGRLERAEAAIAGIAQAGDDVGAGVQFGIDGCGVDRDVGVRGTNLGEAGRAAYDANESQALGAGFLELRHRSRGAESGGQHRIEEHDFRTGEIRRRIEIVGLRAARLLVALHTDVRDCGLGYQPQHAFHHAEPGAQDGCEHDRPGQRRARAGCERGHHLARHGFEIAGGFTQEQRGDFAEEDAELGVFRECVAQLGKLGADEWMVGQRHAGRNGLRCSHAGTCRRPEARCHSAYGGTLLAAGRNDAMTLIDACRDDTTNDAPMVSAVRVA